MTKDPNSKQDEMPAEVKALLKTSTSRQTRLLKYVKFLDLN